MGHTRIKGDALRLTIDGVNYWADCSQVTIAQGDVSTYSGDHDWTMAITAVQSTAPGSLWRLMWAGGGFAGLTDYVYAPHGNESPTDEQPHFVGQLRLPDVSTIGGEAGEDTQYVFSVTVPLDGRPQIITEPTDS